MNMKGRKSLISVFLTLLPAVLLAACGAPTETKLPQPAAPAATGVGMNNCVTCHGGEVKDWLLTRHANLNPAAPNNLNYAGYPSYAAFNAAASCGNCHDPLSDGENLIANTTGNVNRPVVGCESCHGNGSNHNGTGPIGPSRYAAANLGALDASGWFITCATCHELLTDGGSNKAVAVHDPNAASNASAGANNPMTVGQIITDTHFATTINWSSKNGTAASNITGYAMDFSSETVCADCHVTHGGSIDINRDWANSVHASTGSAAGQGAWKFFNWTCAGTNREICGAATNVSDTLVRPISDRRYCQRCHSATGYSAFATALMNGQPAQAESIRSGANAQLPFAWNWKPEMLECRGCHTSANGSLRNPGPYTATYDWRVRPAEDITVYETVYSQASFQYSDESRSNVCILCHSGRTNGQTIKNLPGAANLFTSAAIAAGNAGALNGLVFSDSHHYPVAAVMFRALGYEFAGRNYEDPASFLHKKIGTTAVPNTGTGGPCVGCHMFKSSGSPSHLFEAVGKSGANIVSISSEVCYNCHAGSSSGLAAIVDNERLAYIATLQGAMNTAVSASNTVTGFNMKTSTMKWLSTGDTDTTGNTTGKNNLGAFFNYQSLAFGAEPGAYIHNSTYTKRLIYDSIDWLDDGVLNYSVGTTMNSSSAYNGQTWFTQVVQYLLPNGARPYDPSERP